MVQEYRLLLVIGRTLHYPSGTDSPEGISLVKQLQYTVSSAGAVAVLNVDLLFPATPRSVERVLQLWWDSKGEAPALNRGVGATPSMRHWPIHSKHALLAGGKPSSRRELAAHRQGMPEHRARPVRFQVMWQQLLYWQAQLLVNLQQLK